VFEKLLIANRGEIACRIIRTCQRLGIQSVAVYSEADRGARHVREADEAIFIGPAPARDSYLRADVLVQAALQSGAQAIHPGYGFLSEKVSLLDACAQAGLVFVGPHREAIERMGSKIESKHIARAAGVPCVPGYDGIDQSDAALLEAARATGFPLLIKASAGGGGKGMKRVDSATDFLPQLNAARGEAQAAFGDDQVLLERLIQRPRHLEVQLMGDRHGALVHLYERECSIQRNYQKLIEEAPAPHLTDAQRQHLFDAALKLGRAMRYDSAGTVEFVLDGDHPDQPYFLEMNTRLQVEHPVTELTTGIDLVEAQLRSAMGEALPWTQAQIQRHGWAIEARVNAEIPQDGYRASVGPVLGYEEPRAAGLRVDSAVDAHSHITAHYDAMLAKVIGWGASRETARVRLRQGLKTFRIEGLPTNQGLLVDMLEQAAFQAVLNTGFLAQTYPHGWQMPGSAMELDRAAAVAAAFWFDRGLQRSDRPMDTLAGLRLLGQAKRPRKADEGPLQRLLHCICLATDEVLVSDKGGLSWRFNLASRQLDHLVLNHAAQQWLARASAGGVMIWRDGQAQFVAVESPYRQGTDSLQAGSASDQVVADLPGLVAQVLVQQGQSVTAGEDVMVVEAMKLFHRLTAPRDGVIDTVNVKPGDTVNRATVLIQMRPATP
jgi:3-methylcrotonyl-CoA carboxylase alpha subunit